MAVPGIVRMVMVMMVMMIVALVMVVMMMFAARVGQFVTERSPALVE